MPRALLLSLSFCGIFQNIILSFHLEQFCFILLFMTDSVSQKITFDVVKELHRMQTQAS